MTFIDIQRLLARTADSPGMGDSIALARAIITTTPADAAWFRELGAADDGGLLHLGDLCHDHEAPQIRQWCLMRDGGRGGFLSLWRGKPPTRGQVVCMLLGINDAA